MKVKASSRPTKRNLRRHLSDFLRASVLAGQLADLELLKHLPEGQSPALHVYGLNGVEQFRLVDLGFRRADEELSHLDEVHVHQYWLEELQDPFDE